MKTIEYKDLPRLREMPPGPWDDEPDKVQWLSETGLPCIIRRGPMGAWCGYVGLPEGHPLYGKDYMDENVDVDVHGGLTYAAECDGDETGICHVVEPGDPDPVWWLGFDCAHAFDLVPSMKSIPGLPTRGDVYRNQAYVTAETERLARQLADRG